MNLPKKIVRNNQVIVKRVKHDLIILDPTKGNLYKLNSTAQAIWRTTKVPKTFEAIINTVTSKFSIDKKQAKKDIKQFINHHLNDLFIIVND